MKLSPIVDHAYLLNVTPDQHHAQAHTLASHSTKAHSELTGVTAAQHHAKTTSGEIDHGSVGGLADDDHAQYWNNSRGDAKILTHKNIASAHHAQSHTLASHSTKAHSELTGVTAAQHHAKYLDSEAVAAVSAGDLTKLVVETNTLVADGGKVGIGTASPQARLHIFTSAPGAGVIGGNIILNRYLVGESWRGGAIFSYYPTFQDVLAFAVSQTTTPLDIAKVKMTIGDNGDVDIKSGNLLMASGQTLDGVDISAHAANASAHHAQAHTLASHSTKAHSELTGVTAAQHHAKYLDSEAVAAVSAGNLTKLMVETTTLVADGGKVGIGIASPTTIHADAPLFGGSSPKTEILTGTSVNVDYQELVTLRHTGIDATARTRRLGLLLKLSNEGSVTETNKSGGMVVESPSGYANSPSLYLLTANAKRLRIDYNGDISVITGNVSLAADRTVDGVDISNPVWPTTITHQGATLKSGTQTEGRCHAGLSPFMALAGNQVTVCFREKLTNTPSSVTLSNVPTTSENNMEAGYPQALRVSLFSFGFFIRAAAMGDANSCDKKFVTVGN